MNRKEMIERLRSIDVRAVPTVITMDMGLQYDYMTAEGAGTGFGGMGRWPAHKFSPIEQKKWAQIRFAIQNKTLSQEQLNGTELAAFVDDINTMQPLVLSDVFLNLLALPETLTHAFYCLYDSGKWYANSDKPKFFLKEQEMKNAFIMDYVFDITPWENMSDEELKEWFDRSQDEMSEFPVMTYEPVD